MQTSMGIFCIFVFIVALAIAVFIYVSHAIMNSTLERNWIASVGRFLVGLVMTLYLPFLRIFLNGIDCQYFGNEWWRLPLGTTGTSNIDILSRSSIWQDATCFGDATYIIVWIVSLIVSAAFIVLVVFLSLGKKDSHLPLAQRVRPHTMPRERSLLHDVSMRRAHRAPSPATHGRVPRVAARSDRIVMHARCSARERPKVLECGLTPALPSRAVP
jgi:hypothetical protein